MTSPLNHPLATTHQNPLMPEITPRTDDPAFQPPTDPLDVTKSILKNRATIIHREVPIVTTQTGWTILQVRQAIESLVIGLFDAPAQLMDAITGDSRVHSAFQQRIGGLLGRKVMHQLPPEFSDSPLAKECLDAWEKHWMVMASEPILGDMQVWGFGLGFWVGQQLWDTSGSYWKPYLVPFHPRYTYYHWLYRKYIAITLDGQVPIDAGNGHWVLHTPYGPYRGWMRGAVRAISPWWLARNYALRDWARYSERHGMPIGKAVTPFGADVDSVNKFRSDLGNLGQESIIQLPQSPEPEIGKYDLEWLETKDQAWDGFQGLISQCNAEITLAVLGQNLTSEVKEGSFAAARVHADVRQTILEADARALSQTIYNQIARPFAAINFGNPDLAPRTTWDIIPGEDTKTLSDTFYQFANGVKALKESGKEISDLSGFARQFGIELGKMEDVEAPEPVTPPEVPKV